MAANCRAHCRACNTHFSSDTAFDAHRVFKEGHEGDWDYRVCADVIDTKDKAGKPRFAVKDEHGRCVVASAHVLPDRRIWTLRVSLEAKPDWGRMHERSEEAAV